jgi:LPXTG-site transpeptidase (sortase) family protein
VPELSRLPSIRTTPLRLSDLRPAPAGPVHISIGRLHVSASVVPVASTLTGQLDVPDSAALVGWYRHSAVPGEAGAVVLAAHVDLHGVRGVFFDLVELRKGDRISLQSAGGARSYRVVAKKQVAKTDVSDAGIFDTSGPARLVLVTCGGSFDRSARSYRDNVVVTAVPA